MSPFTRATTLVLLVLAFLPAAHARRGDAEPPRTPCFEAWWRAELDAAAERADHPSALLHVRRVVELSRTATEPRLIFDELDTMRARRGTHPLVAAELDRWLVEEDLRHGRYGKAEERLDRLGTARRFAIAGPFRGADEAGAARETGPAPEAWRAVPTDRKGLLRLHDLLFPDEQGVALASFAVRAEDDAEVALRFGADDEVRVFHEGREIFASEGPHDARFDQHSVFLRLREGLHRFVFQVSQDAGAWNLTARLTAPDGEPLSEEVRFVDVLVPASDDASDERRRRRRSVRGEDVVSLLDERASRRDPLVTAALAVELDARGLPERGSDRALRLARAAANERPGDPRVLWALAAVETDTARRQQAIAQILRFRPDDPSARRKLSVHALAHGRLEEALDMAVAAREACDAFDPWLEGHVAIVEDSPGNGGGALARLERILEDAPHQSMLRLRASTIAQNEGFPIKARHHLERYLETNRSDVGHWIRFVDLAQAAGDSEAQRRAVGAIIEVDPTDPTAVARRAALQLAEGNPDGALRVAEEGLALAPTQPDLLSAKSEALAALGRDHEAAEIWRSLVDVGSGPSNLPERIAAATGEDGSLAARWRLGLDEILAVERQAGEIERAPAVVLHKTIAYRTESDGRGIRFHQMVWRVNNPEQASSVRSFSFGYSPQLQRPRVIDARVVRADGSVLLAGRRDRPMLPDVELRMYYDSRIVTLSFPPLEEGDLVEISYTLSDRGPVNPVAPNYFGAVDMLSTGDPVVDLRVVLDAAESLPLHHELVNLDESVPVRRETLPADEGRRLTVRRLGPLPSVDGEPLSPPATEILPYVVAGTITDWAELGRLYADLMRPQTRIGPDVKEVVREVARTTRGDRGVLEGLYAWVIDNTRYVALAFGIHTLKPYEVDSVFRLRAGDCKDKATLLVAMLREAGVEARVALVRTSGRGAIDTSIPTLAHFDHAIVYVPDEDLWLDGTVLHHAPGELPPPDSGVLALVVDAFGDEPGLLTTTPKMRPEDAMIREEHEIRIFESGRADVEASVEAHGDSAALERTFFRDHEDPTRVLQNRLRLDEPDLRVTSATFGPIDLLVSPVEYEYRAVIPDLARVSGDELEVPIAFGVRGMPNDVPLADRTLPIELPDPFLHEIETRFELPDGYEVLDPLEDVEIDTPWLELSIRYDVSRSSVSAKIVLRHEGGRIPVERAAELNDALVETRLALAKRVRLGRSSR